MSLSAAVPERAPQRAEGRTLLLVIWAVTVATYAFAGLGGETYSTDDAMRLVQIRDLLAGQSWFDVTQYRFEPPRGMPMHWSRLIDLPIAILIRLAELVASPAIAERFATTVWPAGLLLLYFAGVMRLGRDLAGEAAGQLALLFAAVTAPVLQHFRPGAIDHHNAQLLLLVWLLLLLLVRAETNTRSGPVAGLLAALSIAIGLEMAPAIAAIAGLVALRWIVDGDVVKPQTRAFALAFAVAPLTFLVATVLPSHYGDVTCDAMSIAHVLIAAVGGGGLALLVSLGMARAWSRFAAAAGLGALLIAVMAFGFPGCFANPYEHIDPRLGELWLSNVSEARSVMSMLRDLPHEIPAHFGLPAAGLVLGLWSAFRAQGAERWRWLAASAVLAVLTAVAIWEVRGAAAANAVAVALVPAALMRLFPAAKGRAVFLGLSRPAVVGVLLLNPLTLIGIGLASARTAESAFGAVRQIVISDGPGTCRRAADYAPLKALPPGLVLGFIDAGPYILMETPHAVLAAPYFRNGKGNANSAMLDAFLGPPDAARLDALQVDYVAFCPGAPERYNYAAAAPAGLAAMLGRGEVPDFLQRIEYPGSELALFKPRH